jgi:hypothetical protein
MLNKVMQHNTKKRIAKNTTTKTKKRKMKMQMKNSSNISIQLPPIYEAALIAYIALYYNCDKVNCWNLIGEAIEKYGIPTTKTVYRGHSKKDKIIKKVTPFFSTSPLKKMAELFVEKKWINEDTSIDIGHLFKIHLINIPTINTSNIKFTYTKEVIDCLREINNGQVIEKGEGSYTFDEYLPMLRQNINSLVYNDNNSEEILVLNGKTFYKNSKLTSVGFNNISNGNYETWYC